MSNTKAQAEQLKKLEDEAYYELCQIIAEAMQYQDIGLLDSRIASWKNKYKKLLDGSPNNSNFKKRIEFLLTQYYSAITAYILTQLKLKEEEEKKIENQSKAVLELYHIIKYTNDLPTLKKKVKQWEEKYPISGFLKMYQRRIESYTRKKNLEDSAFDQEKAFYELIQITKTNSTFDELKSKLSDWEQEYSINDKFKIDDFIKHQNEVKRYTSDEYLHSIAREELQPDNADKKDEDNTLVYNTNSFSNISLQAQAYSSLVAIAQRPNNVNQIFEWVYKNSHIKFNDKYKELILSATYLDYSPRYLNSLSVPELDISNRALSFEEYQNIDEIKRYAVISYFNLLLPPDKAVSNNYFTKHIQTIYYKSQKGNIANDVQDNSTEIAEVLDSGLEISLKNDSEIEFANNISSKQQPVYENTSDYSEELSEEPQDILETDDEQLQYIGVSTSVQEHTIKSSNTEHTKPNETITIEVSEDQTTKTPPEEIEKDIEIETESETATLTNLSPKKLDSHEATDNDLNLDNATIVAITPQFFSIINGYNKQAVLINQIDKTTSNYVSKQPRIPDLNIDKTLEKIE